MTSSERSKARPMRLLLDTHTLLWVFDGSARLSPAAAQAVADGRNEIYVSAVTAWEIAIKSSLGKLRVRGDYERGLEEYRFRELQISTRHALAVRDLPPHHRDPFDRLLVAQAKLEGLTMVTRDERFGEYDVDYIQA